MISFRWKVAIVSTVTIGLAAPIAAVSPGVYSGAIGFGLGTVAALVLAWWEDRD